MSYYVLRFHPSTPLNLRKHEETLGRFDSYEEAEAARHNREQSHDLVVEGPRHSRMDISDRWYPR